MSDNRAALQNAILVEIYNTFQSTQTCTAEYEYHPTSNGQSGKSQKKVVRHNPAVVHNLHDDWEDWSPQTAVSINSLVYNLIGKSPLSIIYGVEKTLPYDLLT